MRTERHENKKKKRWRWASIFIVLIGVIAVYSYFQYQMGLKSSQGEQLEQFEFNGERDENGATNILIIGSDARADERSRADTIMVVSYHPERGTHKLVSIMRDTYVSVPGYGKNKINTAFAFGGPELLRQTVKENFDINLQYYAVLDFQGFVSLVDVAFPNGIEIDVEKRMSEKIGVTLEPGVQNLDGEHLLGYVRFRQDAIGDFGRVERQQKVMVEMGRQLATFQTISKMPKLIGVVVPFVNTNMDIGDVLFMGRGLLLKEGRNIDTLRIPVENSFQDQRVAGVGAVLAVDLETNKEAFKEFLKN
ncbi:LCP family protein [Bacillus sp. B15-48]|uniref:LCP family protein n=1 Tax=Bacillus sp. B15-48 TaxID=1548601 RepID=UPI00193FFF8B|nr:LCP family protein [Bacillus sp. B15-48]MBM4764191.1 LytR family transcriptional regulator [Bacillus sp. B15-48]